jgi:F-type H+-transporting ATPase subunit b
MILQMNSIKQIARVIMLTLLAASFVCVTGSARAQDQPASPANGQQSDDSARQPGFAQQLTRETREAAGEDKEEKDKASFRQSASVRFIANKLGINTETASFLCFLFNFGVIVGILIWATRKHLPRAFRARTAAIQKAMQEAQKASEEARRRLAEVESRLMRLDGEIGMMRNAAEKEAAAEESRIRAAAEEDARKMLESAQQEIAATAKAARRGLTAYAAELAVGLAQKQIRVDAATDQALVRNFAGQLGASSESSAENQGKGTQ